MKWCEGINTSTNKDRWKGKMRPSYPNERMKKTTNQKVKQTKNQVINKSKSQETKRSRISQIQYSINQRTKQ